MKRIYVDMCADLFHAGHVSYLKQVKELYEDGYVIVGIHSDETIESYVMFMFRGLLLNTAVVIFPHLVVHWKALIFFHHTLK